MIQDQTGYNQINPDHGELKIFAPARKNFQNFIPNSIGKKMEKNGPKMVENDRQWPKNIKFFKLFALK